MNAWVVCTPLSIKLKRKSSRDFSEHQWTQNDAHWNEYLLIVTGPYQEHRGLPLKNNLSLPVAQSGSWWDSPAMNADSKLDKRLARIFLTCETCSLEYETKCLVHTPWLLEHELRLFIVVCWCASFSHTQRITAPGIVKGTTALSLCQSASVRNQLSHSSSTSEFVCKSIKHKPRTSHSLHRNRYFSYLSQHW